MHRVEAFEDRMVELALEFGGYARIWRSCSKKNPERVVRGLLLDLVPGLETISLLVSPEGYLLSASQIDEAEEAPFADAPWVRIRTEFGTVEAHILIVEMLAALRKDFFPTLEIIDEGEYDKSQNIAELRRRHNLARISLGLPAIEENSRIESAESDDPKLSATHINKAIKRLRTTVARPPEHPPVDFSGCEDAVGGYRCAGTEELWEKYNKQTERRQTGLSRAFEERNLSTDDTRKSFSDAMRSEGMIDVPGIDDKVEGDFEFDEDESDSSEARKKHSLDDGDDDFESPPPEKHPLMKRMTRLTMRVMKLPERGGDTPNGPMNQMVKGIFEMSGGLTQVFGATADGEAPYGQILMQLKRALRGAAFAHGGLIPAKHMGLINENDFSEIYSEVAEIEREINNQMQITREQWKTAGK